MRGETDAQRRRFPWHCRYSAIALSYNISQAVFAGTAPLAATAILTASGGEVWAVSCRGYFHEASPCPPPRPPSPSVGLTDATHLRRWVCTSRLSP